MLFLFILFLLLVGGLNRTYRWNTHHSSAQSGSFTNTIGPVSFTVSGASFLENNSGTPVFAVAAGSTITISATAAQNPLCCINYSASSDMNISISGANGGGTFSYTNGSGLAISTSDSYTVSNADQQVSGSISFYTFCGILRGCPDSWQDTGVSMSFVIQPTISLYDNVSSGFLSEPGCIVFTGFVLPNSMSVNLSAYQNGVYTYSVPAYGDANGMYNATMCFSTPDQVGTYNVIASAPIVYDYNSGAALNANASVSFSVINANTSTSVNNNTSVATDYTPPFSQNLTEISIAKTDTTYQGLPNTITTIDYTTANSTTTANHLPIIFIPGIAGTFLVRASDSNTVWPCPNAVTTGCAASKYLFGYTTYWQLLMSDSNGAGEYGAGVVPGDILQSGFKTNFYGGFISYLKTLGYVPNVDLYVFPYDWRHDVTTQFSDLDYLVHKALDATGESKVILIGHSMGGLIADGYVHSDPTRAALVDSLITIGTPYFGAPKAYYAITQGYTFGNAIITPEIMKVVAQNSPGAYDLIPRVPFIQDTNGSFLTYQQATSIYYPGLMSNSMTPVTPLNVTDSAKLILSPGFPQRTPTPTWTFNPTILGQIQTIGDLIGPKGSPNPLPPGIKQYVIIGTGVQTLGYYRMVDAGSWPDYYLYGNQHVIMVPQFQDGDGTVPIRMAQISTATDTYYVPYHRSIFTGGSSEHGALTDNTQAQQIVGTILGGNPASPSSFPYNNQALTNRDKDVNFTLHSNAQLTIIDPKTGDRLGYNAAGGIDETIGTATFIQENGIEYASIQNVSEPLTVLVNGSSTGNFTLTVNYSNPNGNIAFAYHDVQVQNGTQAQLAFDPSTISLNDRTSVPALNVKSYAGSSSVSPTIESMTTRSISQNGSGSGDAAVGGIVIALTIGLIFAAILVFRRKGKDRGS